MWKETLLESNPRSRVWLFPLSAVLHVSTILLFVGASFWRVEAVQPLANRDPVLIPIGLPRSGSSAPAARATPKGANANKRKPIVQPVVIPPNIESKTANPLTEDVTGGTDDSLITDGAGGGDEPGFQGSDANGPGVPITSVPDALRGPMVLTPEMHAPVLLTKVTPEYPEVLRRARVEGTVILQAVITEKGSVEEVRALSSPHALLSKISIEAVRQWRYRPAVFNSKAIKVYFKIYVHFKLK